MKSTKPSAMTGCERMLKTLRFEEPDRPPHFEIWFQLAREAFGVEHPKYERMAR